MPDTSAPTASNFKATIKLALAAFLLALLFSYVDWKETFAVVSDGRLLQIFAAVFLFLPLFYLSAKKWQLLLGSQGVKVRFSELNRIYWVGYFLSNFTPSNVGGDVFRLGFIKPKAGLLVGGTSIFMERLTGFLILLFYGLWTALFRPNWFVHEGVAWTIGFLIVLLILGFPLLLLCSSRLTKYLSRKQEPLHRFKQKTLVYFSQITDSFSAYQKAYKCILVCLLMSVTFYGLRFCQQVLMVSALNLTVPYPEIFFIAPLIDLAWALPISLNGLGVVEGAYVFFYTSVGLAPAEALALAVLSRFIHLGSSSLGGLFLILPGQKKTGPIC